MFRIVAVLVLAACCQRASADVDFSHDVVPILKEHCAECHTGEESEGGFSFNTERLLQDSEAITPGDAAASRLVELIISDDSDEQMPPEDRDRLSKDEIQVLRDWINEGEVWESGFRFGAAGYEPPLLPRDVELPPAEFDGQHPIDRILAKYSADNSLPRLKPASDHVFVKRASMDLVGLLPTIEEQTAFFEDDSDDARMTVIDRLLSRDNDYAEHWMTFWNDLLRNDYAGTGFIDGGRTQMSGWLYRALAENTPYDQFVRELIAPTPESQGFISGIKWRGDVNASQVREIQFAQNVGQVLLGINMKCASCHDSFIDRWTLDESYGLAAIYSERELEIHRCDKPTGRIASAAWIFPELGQVNAHAEQPERLRQLSLLITRPDNGRFNRTIVNRLWHRLMGHGIVHPVDAMHTRPWNEDLLDYLANELVAGKYDLKHVLRLIATSAAYQAQSAPAIASVGSDEYVFRGPVARDLTAEQFMDNVWHLTRTTPRSVDAPIPMELYVGANKLENQSAVVPGQWIWGHLNADVAAGGEKVEFRRTFELKELPQRALCVLTCDNECSISVNGTMLKEGITVAEIPAIDVTPQLRAGLNEIIIVGSNGASSPNPAGLYVDVILLFPDQLRVLNSGPEWESRMPPSEGEWTSAVVVNNQEFLGSKFQKRIKSTFESTYIGVARTTRAALLKSDMLMRSLGRPNREQVVTVRPESLSTLQAIDLANGKILNDILALGGQTLVAELSATDDFVGTLYRQALCREPTESERVLANELLGSTPDADSIQDLLWTLIMLPEFQFVR